MQDLTDRTMQPATPEELAEALGAANAAGQAVQAGGRGTKARWGGPVGDAAVRISTAKLNHVLEYEPRDLTISVGAGMSYAELTAILTANKQMIPLDPAYAATATVGGVLAANQSGPRRRLYGTGRDLVIGMRFATMAGKVVQSGGMVVKNVAGLDMSKLLVGSWGTLGVMATVNFKLIPLDKATRTFLLGFATGEDALAERNRILQSVLQPAAMDLLNPAAATRVGREGWVLAVGVGGSQALVDRYSRELAKATVLEGAEERTFWTAVEGFAAKYLEAHPKGWIVRASTTLQGLGAAIAGHDGPIVARAANGVAYLYFADTPKAPDKRPGFWPAPGAHIVYEAGPDGRDGAALWPEPGSDFPVMEKIKNMLDPKHLLNKGRLYGRI